MELSRTKSVFQLNDKDVYVEEEKHSARDINGFKYYGYRECLVVKNDDGGFDEVKYKVNKNEGINDYDIIWDEE